MATARLTFLYPLLLRATARTTAPPSRGACEFGTSSKRRWDATRTKSSFARRAGKAVEPAGFEKPEQKSTSVSSTPQQQEQQQEQPPVTPPLKPADAQVGGDNTSKTESPKPPIEQNTEANSPDTGGETIAHESAPAPSPETKDSSDKPDNANAASSTTPTIQDTAPGAEKESKAAGEGNAKGPEQETKEKAKDGGPLDAVLHMQAPENPPKLHPSMSPPPYVHHFDSYSLVRELEAGGFSRGQATTTMKGIRAILAQNLGVAQESLVSKSDVENETYLFQAACSELSTEIAKNRRQSEEQDRQQRMHLQNEVDILTQSLNQELSNLKDDVRGMFNDRKMAVREEENAAESAVQQISHKISILLSSDSKSEIEGVRWTLIRRSVLGIIFLAILTLGTLRYATFVGKERQRELEKMKKEEEELKRSVGKKDQLVDADAAAILSAN